MKRARAGVLMVSLLAATPALAQRTVYYVHTDALGSVVMVTDANRNVVERTQYAPYGQVLNRPEHEGPGYTGHEEDPATGMTNMQARYDDKVIGRMDSIDPVGVDPDTGANFNRYAYANDNPYRYTDPDGRSGAGDEKPSQRLRDWKREHQCTGSHICGGALGALPLSVTQVGTPSVSAAKAAVTNNGGAQGSHGDMRVTQGERQDAQGGKVEAYYKARLAQGDPIAKIGLASLHPPGGILDYLFGGESVNVRLEAFSRVYTGHSINMAGVRIDLMNAQVRAIDADKTGIIGLLGPGQVYDYHIAVFRNYGLPSTAFGGTPFTGERWEAYLTAPIWCSGCDR